MKLQRIESLRSEARCVLMIGDGVNDAPVLAGADVSMSVKGGADLANSAADMILTTDSLEPVTMAIEIARKTKALVRQNLVWAAFYNASIMPLAVFGLLQPWMAALGMSLSSLLVVANASRLVRTRQSPKAVRMETELEAGAA
jgi:Cu2+-exporting ATPase